MMKQKQILRLALGLVIASGLLGAWAGAAFPASLGATGKIEQDLLEAFATEGTADFVVRFVEQADLSPAYSMDWDARGEFVYSTLRAVVERSQAGVKAYLDSRGLRYRSFIAGNELYVWSGDQTAANGLAELSDVASIRAAYTYDVGLMNHTETDSPEWNIEDTGAVAFWGILRRSGEGIRVANIGTGVYPFHPALHPHYACGSDYTDPRCWHDPSNICGGTMCDNVGISTHSTGIMAGDDGGSNQIGMAPGATWIACKGCETGSCSEFALNACADWVLAPDWDPNNRPHVVDNSWGVHDCDAWYLTKIQAWRASGIFPTFPAGNSGSGCSSLRSPGDYQESFASAGHDSSRNIAPFSSRGPSCFGHTPFTKPNISAPGVNIRSAWNDGGYHAASGTGMASPHSAGAVALLWSCSPAMVGQIDFTFEVLHAAAAPGPAGNCGAPPDGEGNYTYGYGYLNVLAAGLAMCGGAWLPGTDDPFDFNRYDCAWFDDGSGPSNYNQKVYCMGGRTGGGTESPDIWRYDPVADSWQDTGHNMVEDVSNYHANVLQDEGGWAIYVVSGYDVETYSNTTYVQRYYPAIGFVGSVPTDPWPLTVAGYVATPGGCITVQNRIYCFGGWEADAPPYFSDETWEYDPARPAGSRWQRITTANLHQPRGYLQFAAQNDVIYAMGGHYVYNGDLVPSSMVETLDVNALAAGWQMHYSMPVASAEGRGFGWAGKVYVVGGGDWPDQSAEAMEYDIASNTWDLDFPNLITARRNHAGVLIPVCTPDPDDGLPGMWVFGGRIASDDPPFGSPEYFPFQCFQVFLPLAVKNY